MRGNRPVSLSASKAAAAVVLCVLGAGTASAESLQQALVSAYLSNPALDAQRATLRAIDEEVPRAKSGRRPTVTGSYDTGRERFNSSGRTVQTGTLQSTGRVQSSLDGGNWPSGYSFSVDQPLFRGFRTRNAVKEAKASVRAGREDLRTVEQNTLLDAVTAYMDVVRDQEIVSLNENNVKVLSEQLKATEDRFEVGEVTKTDVAQAEARLSRAKSDLSTAQGNLKTSRATYERVIGNPPSNLKDQPPIDRLVPRELGDATSIGESENPTILSATFQEQAARFDLKQIKGELLPEVRLEASFDRRFDPSRLSDETETARVGGRVTVPLYQAGDVAARARQARETVSRRQRELDDARRVVQANVISAWSVLSAARARIESDEAEVRANKIALDGVREEEKVGQRTVLDVLDAEQELLDSRSSLVTSKRDTVVASYALVAAIGRLDSMHLNLPVQHYDPTEHYRRVKNKAFGLRPGRTHTKRMTRPRP